MRWNFRSVVVIIVLVTLNKGYAQSLDWARQLGADNGDQIITDMVIDESNFIYVVGYFEDTLSIGVGQDSINLNGGGGDMFCAKLNTFGEYLWIKNWGNASGSSISPSAIAEHICVDSENNLLITGTFRHTIQFDTFTDSITSVGSRDVFLLKLDENGAFIWARSWGGSGTDRGVNVASDSNGDIYVSGEFSSDTVDFDPGPGTFNLSPTDQAHAFISKFDTEGDFLWGKQFVSLAHAGDVFLTIDPFDNVYISGEFDFQADLNPDSSASMLLESAGDDDVYIIKLRSDGSFVYGRQIGDEADDFLGATVTDSVGNFYVCGSFEGTVDLDFGPDSAIFTTIINDRYGFVAKYDSSGAFVWAQAWGDDQFYAESAQALTVDALGNVYVAGHFDGTVDFDPGPGVSELTHVHVADGYISMFEPNGVFSWVRHLSSTGNVWPIDMLVDSYGSIYSTGTVSGLVDFDPAPDSTLVQMNYSDSYILKLNFCPPVYSSDALSTCGPFNSSNGIYSWSESGIYTDWLTSSSGCDSLIALDLTILSSTSVIDTLVCDAFVSPSGLHTWTQSGTYSDTLANSTNCDSIVTVNLEIGNTFDTLYQSVCNSYSSVSGNYLYTQTGVYTDTIPNISGCDSIITVHLNVSYPSDTLLSVSICDTYSSPSGNYTWTTSGIYQDTLSTIMGCDSTITIDLIILEASYDTVDIESCGNFSSPSGNYVYTNSGGYSDTLTNVFGCDSIIHINLTVVNIDTSVSVAANVLSSNASGVSYQWVDCNTYVPIIGETNSEYEASSNGSFAVILHQNSCADTSTCIDISSFVCSASFTLYPDPNMQHNWFVLDSSTGIQPIAYEWSWGDGETTFGLNPSHTYDTAGYYNICLSITDANGCIDSYCDNSTYIYKTMQMVTVNVVSELPNGIAENQLHSPVEFYPNPSSGKLKIDAGIVSNDLTISSYNMLGELVKTEVRSASGIIEYDLPNEKGIYVVQLVCADGKVYKLKVVKE